MKFKLFSIFLLAIFVDNYDATHIPKLTLIRILEDDLNNVLPQVTKYITTLRADIGRVSGSSLTDKLKALPSIYSLIADIYHCFTIGASQFTDYSNTIANGRGGLEVPFAVINRIINEYKNASITSKQIGDLYNEMEQLIQVVVSDYEQQGSNANGQVVVSDNLAYGILITLRKIQRLNAQIANVFTRGANQQQAAASRNLLSGFGIGGHAFINTLQAVGLKWGRLDHGIASNEIGSITRSYQYAQMSGSDETMDLTQFVTSSYKSFTSFATNMASFIGNIKSLQLLIPGIEVI